MRKTSPVREFLRCAQDDNALFAPIRGEERTAEIARDEIALLFQMSYGFIETSDV